MSKDYYKILGVEKNATADEVKKAFKKLAMQHHPDRPGGDEKKFKEINEAFQVLGDADKRAKFDQFGSDFEQQGGWNGAGGSWEDIMNAFRQQGGGQGANFDFGGGFGDIFGDLFGGGGQSRTSRRQSRGRDIQVDVEIDFKEAAFGVEKDLNLRKQSACDVCRGTGAEPGSKMEKCGTCHGQGQVVQQQRTFMGMMQTVAACPTCQGRGEHPSKKCKHCGGDGILAKSQEVKVKIPAGIDDGQSIRLSGYGEAAPHGAGAGDLYVQVHVRQNKIFHREGFDVYAESEINFVQAVLGDKLDIDTIDGKLKIVIPEGAESGALIRLKGHGIAHINSNTRGDHYVKVKIRVPRKFSRDVRKKLEDLKNDL
ncbi:MAG: molecular chaperone DnaJ [Candidatus Magasanikbacteria bacterium RIFOXYA2_FULL_44_8]|uniref:Chaperone protein DnaJ n=1 Tax=Candidatus Magasanikbacteria bacterium RIFOXYA2_FULL_44_8 TaxID=1798696 RepID=A0A1F6NLA9_9BACT|nr:MAG: molecular chaperone DnaJ [Candidatus Magasanikbacteria bacterium RIFOXYA2_FULL_44_8]